MNNALYTAGIRAYGLLLKIIRPFHRKAAQSVVGRKDLFLRLQSWRSQHQGPLLWVHAASLGEFEQGRPIIEGLKEQYPQYKILLTFFSPSGYEIRKDYPLADGVFYLPLDTPNHAQRWVEILQPEAAIWVKYEYWANFFFELKRKEIPIIMVSAIFRPGQRFFNSNNGFWKKVLQCVDHFFIQNQQSADLLRGIDIHNFTVAGDTRFDRVVEISDKAEAIDLVEKFVAGRKVVVIGSSYPAEEAIIQDKTEQWCWIVAPHEINSHRIDSLKARWPKRAMLYSQLQAGEVLNGDILIVDNVGMLSRIYQYSSLTIIGGGFGKGIHNTLEAAVYGQPLVFGPNYQKFDEAIGLVRVGAAFSAQSFEEFKLIVQKLLNGEEVRQEASKAAKDFVRSGQGAKNHILNFLKTRLKHRT
ncbi:MAG: hypothetical protein RLZZ77_67 [Bacteroidota bacterium]